jgi:hypothetical protein
MKDITFARPSLESSFGNLLVFALREYCDRGRLAGRRYDDLLFNEYDRARDGDFSGWIVLAMSDPTPPDVPEHLRRRGGQWPVLIIQAAIHTLNPELIAAILAADMDYELADIADNEWVDEAGNPAPLPDEVIEDDQRAVMAWPSNWRRVFGSDGRLGHERRSYGA